MGPQDGPGSVGPMPQAGPLRGCAGRPWEARASVEPWPRSKYSLGTGAGAFPELLPHSWPWGGSRTLRSTAAATAGCLTVSWGTGAACQAAWPRPGPHRLGPGHRLSQMGNRGRVWEHHPRGCACLGIREGQNLDSSSRVISCLSPPPHLGGASPLRKPAWPLRWDRVSGQALWVPRRAQRGWGLFYQRFRPMPGCRDRGQWPNRPHHMPSGPRQECHSSSCARTVTAGGAEGTGSMAWWPGRGW